MKSLKYKPFRSNDETSKNSLDIKKEIQVINENSDVTKRGG
jgi:hypothetical protein